MCCTIFYIISDLNIFSNLPNFNMQKIIKLFFYIFLFITSISLTYGLNTSEKKSNSIDKNQILKVSVLTNSPPFSEYNENTKQFSGLSIEYWKLIARELKLKYKFIPVYTTSEQAVKDISTGNYDVLVGPISVTNQRIKTVDFSRGYFLNYFGIAVKKTDNSFLNIIITAFGKTIIILGLTFVIISLLFANVFWVVERGYRISRNYFKGIGQTFWYTIASFVGVVRYDPFKKLGKTILFFWLLTSIIYIIIASSLVTSSLTIALAQRTITDIHNRSDLHNKLLAAEKGSYAIKVANKYASNIEIVPSIEKGLTLLEQNKIDGFVGDYYIVNFDISQSKIKNLEMLNLNLANDEYAFVFQKNSKLKQGVDYVITELQDTGISSLLCQKSLGTSETQSCEL